MRTVPGVSVNHGGPAFKEMSLIAFPADKYCSRSTFSQGFFLLHLSTDVFVSNLHYTALIVCRCVSVGR